MWIALVGSKKVRANPIRRKLPVCLAHLTSFHEIALTSGKYDDLLFVTIFSCCFYGCYRSGELIVKNAKNEFDQWRKVIKHHSLRFDGRWHSSPWFVGLQFWSIYICDNPTIRDKLQRAHLRLHHLSSFSPSISFLHTCCTSFSTTTPQQH